MVALGIEVFGPRRRPEQPAPADARASARCSTEIATGATNREIGERLHLSPHTIKEHTSAIYRKLERPQPRRGGAERTAAGPDQLSGSNPVDARELECLSAGRAMGEEDRQMAAATVAEVDLDAVDLMDPRWFADGPPHELFARHARGGAGALERAPGGRRLLVADPPRGRHRRQPRHGDVLVAPGRDLPAPRPGRPARPESQPAAVQGPARAHQVPQDPADRVRATDRARARGR